MYVCIKIPNFIHSERPYNNSSLAFAVLWMKIRVRKKKRWCHVAMTSNHPALIFQLAFWNLPKLGRADNYQKKLPTNEPELIECKVEILKDSVCIWVVVCQVSVTLYIGLSHQALQPHAILMPQYACMRDTN